jgi:hypothetical protein
VLSVLFAAVFDANNTDKVRGDDASN